MGVDADNGNWVRVHGAFEGRGIAAGSIGGERVEAFDRRDRWRDSRHARLLAAGEAMRLRVLAAGGWHAGAINCK
jgi:hypothetical protein